MENTPGMAALAGLEEIPAPQALHRDAQIRCKLPFPWVGKSEAEGTELDIRGWVILPNSLTDLEKEQVRGGRGGKDSP